MTSDPFDSLESLLRRRHSCRGFLAEPVPRHAIERILSAAQRAPSWCNAQPWRLTITAGAETERLRSALLEHVETADQSPDIPFPSRYAGPYKERRSACGWQLYGAVGVERGDREGAARQTMENYRFFGAPHVAIVSTPRDLGVYGAIDCGGFVTAFVLAAEAAGVASIPQAAIAPYAPFLRSHLGLPDDRWIVCAISFGYEDADHSANGFRTERASLEEIVDWRL